MEEGGGPAEQGSGVYTVDSNGGGGVGGITHSLGSEQWISLIATSTARNTYRVHYYVREELIQGGTSHIRFNLLQVAVDGAQPEAFTHSWILSLLSPEDTAYGGSAGNAIKTNGYTCTVSSGSTEYLEV